MSFGKENVCEEKMVEETGTSLVDAQQEFACKEGGGLYDNTSKDKYLTITFSRLTFRDCKIFAKSKFREKKLPGQLKTPNLVFSSKKHCSSQLYWSVALLVPKTKPFTRMIQRAPTGRLSTVAFLNFRKLSAL